MQRSKVLKNRDATVLARRGGEIVWSVARALLLIGLSFIILYPIIYMISVSFRMPDDLMDPSVVWIPKNFTFSNYEFVFIKTEYFPAFLRTLSLSLVCSIFQMFSCAMTGYGFARFRFKGRTLLFFGALLTFIVPPQIISMPLYTQYSAFTKATGIQMIGTILPSTLSAFFSQGLRAGLFIYLFRQFFKNLPLELEDAAHLDGCSPISAYFKVMLPNAAPMLLVTFILTFVWYWNDYINVALFFGQSKPLAVLLSGLSDLITTMRGANGTGYTMFENNVFVNTFCLLFILPPIIFYGFLQKRFTENLVNAGIVG